MDYEKIYREFDWNRFCDEQFDWDWKSRFNIAYAAVDRNAADEEKIAIYHVRRDSQVDRITYVRLRMLTNKFANLLAELGLSKGDRVARLLPRIPETYICFFGTWKSGMVDVPLYTAFGPDAIEYRLKDSGAKVLITDWKNHKKLASISNTLKDLHVILVGKEDHQELQSGEMSFSEQMEKAGDTYQIADTQLHDPALLVYTSGTTGPPKGTIIQQKGVISVVPYAKYYLDVRRDEMFWGFADPGWTYGLLSAGSAPMIVGGSLVVYEPGFQPGGWYKTAKQLGVTNFTAAPTAFRAIMAAGEDLAKDYKLQFRHLSSAGEPLNAEVIQWFEKNFGVPVRDNYGITEVSMVMGNNPGLPVRPGYCGKPIPGFEVMLVDETGQECGVRQPGQICVKHHGFFIADGYWGKKEKWRDSFVREEWFITGDLGYKDEDGYYYFVGRSDDVISCSGYRIGPFEVESCIMEHPAVAECAVVGKPDALRGEIVKAFIVLRSNFEASDEVKKEITEMTRNKLSKHNYPREIAFVEELPKTTTGKIQRMKLRELEKQKSDPLTPNAPRA